jgi:LacI family transcriptional regulator
MKDILDSPERPTGLFAGSDFVAIGAMQHIGERGLRVPDDISLVGFDDMPFAGLLAPPLTTIRQPVQELGRKAFQALFAVMNEQPLPDLGRLPTTLVERQSVARRPWTITTPVLGRKPSVKPC